MRASRILIVVSTCAALAGLAISGPATAAEACRAVPVDCLQPAPLAQIPGARFAWGTTGGDAPDAWVARFDGDTQDPTWRVSLGGSGVDTVSTVTLSSGGAELLVAGATTSPTIEGIAGRNSGGRDGFVVRLDAATGKTLSGTFIGGPDDEELSGVTVDREGNILVTGVGKLPGIGETPATLTVVEPNDATGSGSSVFLSTLDGKLGGERARFDLGTIQTKHPRVWTDCHGDVAIGTVPLGAGDCNGNWPDLVYEQDQISQDYAIDHDFNNTAVLGYPPGGWGFHALRWKQYHANAHLPVNAPPYVLDWTLHPPNVNIPKQSLPACSDAGVLNQLETALYSQNGVPADPPGGWGCATHTSMAQLALFSAYAFHRWGTPIYTHLGQWDDLNSTNTWTFYKQPVALERAIFHPFCSGSPNAYHGETINDLCNLGVDNVYQLTCTLSTGTPGVAGNDFLLRFDKFEGSKWLVRGGWWYRLDYWLSDTSWWWQEWYEAGDFLMDPPAGSEAEVEILQEAARQSADQIVRPGTVRVTQLTNGAPVCTEALQAVISANE